MKVKKYLEKVAYVAVHPEFKDYCYYSKFDDSYITRVGMEDNIKCLADKEITEELTHGVGFSPKDGKWYGWSHRAIFGFKIGSTCKKGDCHYKGSTLKEKEEAAVDFWTQKYHKKVRCEGVIKQDGENFFDIKDGENFFDIKWVYTKNVPNKSLRKTTGRVLHHIKSCGRGEWVAKTMVDAKQMAVDFNEGVR